MPERVVQRVRLADVDIKPPVAPTPIPPVRTPTPPVRLPIIESFIEEHKKLKSILDRYGAEGKCARRSELERESGITGKRLDQHLRVLTNSDAAASITEEGEEVLCGKRAIEELKKKIKLELGG